VSVQTQVPIFVTELGVDPKEGIRCGTETGNIAVGVCDLAVTVTVYQTILNRIPFIIVQLLEHIERVRREALPVQGAVTARSSHPGSCGYSQVSFCL